MWCIPKLDQEYEERMLDVLEVYERPYDRLRPVVCIDEKSFQLLSHDRPGIGMREGRAARVDYEYTRHGTANAFVAVEPQGNKRIVRITLKRTKKDFAKFLNFVVMQKYKRAQKVILVTDNLNTHNLSSLVETYGEKRARKIFSRIEWHYTPKHGSWLNMAEIEINVLSRQCLKRDFTMRSEVVKHVRSWERRRNLDKRGIHWSFTRARAKEVFKLS